MDAVRLRSSDTFSAGKWYRRQKQDCKCLKGGKGWGDKLHYLFPTQNTPRISVRHKLCSVHGYHGTSTNCGVLKWAGNFPEYCGQNRRIWKRGMATSFLEMHLIFPLESV